MARLVDRHTLYLLTGPCTRQQIFTVVSELARQFERHTGEKTYFDLNLPVSFDGKPRCCAYLFVSNPSFYHVLLGKSPDGSARYHLEDDPSYIPKESNKPKSFDFNSSMNWADLDDDDEVLEKEDPELGKIRVIDPPLLTVPSVDLTQEQSDWMEETEGFPTTIYHIQFQQAFVYQAEEGYSPNVLVIRGLEDWITAGDLKKMYGKYSTSHNTKRYPEVDIKKNIGFVTYDPSTHDGEFAVVMTKKRTYTRDGKSAQLFTSHYCRSNNRTRQRSGRSESE